jgi:hypothetical protein
MRAEKLKNLIIFPLLWLAFGQIIRAQPPTDELPNPHLSTKENIARNNYITPIYDLKNLEEKYLAAPRWKISYLERIIQLESFVGNYEQAYAYEELFYQNLPATKSIIEQYKNDINSLKESPVANFKMLDAVDAIESVAENHQVIMINEEHRTPFHRAVTLEMLEKLYKKGFRYFAAETVTESETDLNKRGYPTQKTGYYSADPIYADVIRTALRLGYKIVPYESLDATCRAPENNPEFCNDKREREQAQNLYDRILKTDPQAKIFVHVGRSHNSKAAVSKEFNFMAYYFWQLSKIEPLTIDQLNFSERRNRAMEKPLYRLLTKENMLAKPSVFQSPNGGFYNQGFGYDILVFHPRMQYEKGRATFLKMNGLHTAEKINLKKLKLKSNSEIFNGDEPILIQAFYDEENLDAVPIDQIILYPNKQIPVLMLPKGKFRFRALDKAGKILGQYQSKR